MHMPKSNKHLSKFHELLTNIKIVCVMKDWKASENNWIVSEIFEYVQKNTMYIEILNALIKSKTSECMKECNIDITF